MIGELGQQGMRTFSDYQVSTTVTKTKLWASILAMPYAILAGAIPPRKMGIYMGVFNFFITLPQIVNGIFGGPIVKYFFNNDAIYALVLAGLFMLCAAVSVVYVYDPASVKLKNDTK